MSTRGGPPSHPKTHALHCLSPGNTEIEQKLPPQYAKFAKVFDEPKDGKLPP